MSGKFKRRNYFIKKDFQGRMILGVFLFAIGSIVLFTVILGLFSAGSITMSYENNHLQIGRTPVMLLKNVLAANWVFIIIGGSLLILAALLVSHRIAGPQFRFEKALAHMLGGDLTDTIHLRSRDEGNTLADLLNTFNRQLSARLREIDKHARAIEQTVAAMNQDTTPEHAEKLRHHADAIRKVTASFTLLDE